MTVEGLVSLLDGKAINLADGDREISCGYAGDFLSFVMGKAPTDCAWFTVMSNVNVCAVATLADVSVIVLCEDVEPDAQLLNRVVGQNVNLVGTKLDVYNAIKRVCNEI